MNTKLSESLIRNFSIAIIGAVAFQFFFMFYFLFAAPDFWMRTLYLCGGIVISGIYILIDLMMVLEPGIMKTDDYIMGALMLYLDLVRMFLYILELMGS